MGCSIGGLLACTDGCVSRAAVQGGAGKQHVMCQEIGHDFGLDQQFTNAGSCMDYALQDDPNYTSPNSPDYSELLAIYNHGDGAAAASAPGSTTIVAGGVVTSIYWKD
jgi:hypothetical protein